MHSCYEIFSSLSAYPHYINESLILQLKRSVSRKGSSAEAVSASVHYLQYIERKGYTAKTNGKASIKGRGFRLLGNSQHCKLLMHSKRFFWDGGEVPILRSTILKREQGALFIRNDGQRKHLFNVTNRK